MSLELLVILEFEDHGELAVAGILGPLNGSLTIVDPPELASEFPPLLDRVDPLSEGAVIADPPNINPFEFPS